MSSRPCVGAFTTSSRLVATRDSGTVKFAMRQGSPTLRTVMVPVAPPGVVAPRPSATVQAAACGC